MKMKRAARVVLLAISPLFLFGFFSFCAGRGRLPFDRVAAFCDWRGRTALYGAVTYGRVEAVRLLLAHGADANAKDAKGETPLMMLYEINEKYLGSGIGERHAEIKRLLLEAGAKA